MVLLPVPFIDPFNLWCLVMDLFGVGCLVFVPQIYAAVFCAQIDAFCFEHENIVICVLPTLAIYFTPWFLDISTGLAFHPCS